MRNPLAAMLLIAFALTSTHRNIDGQAWRTNLDSAFMALKVADTATARQIESQILEVWNRGGDSTANKLLAEANRLISASKQDSAYELLNKALKVSPGFMEAYNRRAYVHFLRGHYQAAVNDIGRAISIDNRNYRAYMLLGSIFELEKNYFLAMAAYEMAKEINPSVEMVDEKLRYLRHLLGIRLT